MNRLLFLFFIVFASQLSIAQTKRVKIDSLLSAYVSQYKFNGTVLVVEKGKKSYEKSYGYSNKTQKN